MNSNLQLNQTLWISSSIHKVYILEKYLLKTILLLPLPLEVYVDLDLSDGMEPFFLFEYYFLLGIQATQVEYLRNFHQIPPKNNRILFRILFQ